MEEKAGLGGVVRDLLLAKIGGLCPHCSLLALLWILPTAPPWVSLTPVALHVLAAEVRGVVGMIVPLLHRISAVSASIVVLAGPKHVTFIYIFNVKGFGGSISVAQSLS